MSHSQTFMYPDAPDNNDRRQRCLRPQMHLRAPVPLTAVAGTLRCVRCSNEYFAHNEGDTPWAPDFDRPALALPATIACVTRTVPNTEKSAQPILFHIASKRPYASLHRGAGGSYGGSSLYVNAQPGRDTPLTMGVLALAQQNPQISHDPRDPGESAPRPR